MWIFDLFKYIIEVDLKKIDENICWLFVFFFVEDDDDVYEEVFEIFFVLIFVVVCEIFNIIKI